MEKVCIISEVGSQIFVRSCPKEMVYDVCNFLDNVWDEFVVAIVSEVIDSRGVDTTETMAEALEEVLSWAEDDGCDSDYIAEMRDLKERLLNA